MVNSLMAFDGLIINKHDDSSPKIMRNWGAVRLCVHSQAETKRCGLDQELTERVEL
jgi:hypothetical protein